MKSHSELSDNQFIEQFKDCSLDPSLFDHEAHLRLAWIHIKNDGVEMASKKIQDQLQKFVSHVGAQNKYHATVTVAAVEAVNHFMKKSSTETFEDFIAQNPQLKSNLKELLNSHYSFDIFQSSEAQHSFLEPDVQPFG